MVTSGSLCTIGGKGPHPLSTPIHRRRSIREAGSTKPLWPQMERRSESVGHVRVAARTSRVRTTSAQSIMQGECPARRSGGAIDGQYAINAPPPSPPCTRVTATGSQKCQMQGPEATPESRGCWRYPRRMPPHRARSPNPSGYATSARGPTETVQGAPCSPDAVAHSD